jgi:hypothetical protein
MAGSDARRDRLAAALRENLKKRKARARAAALGDRTSSKATPGKQRPLPATCAVEGSPPRRPNAASKRD